MRHRMFWPAHRMFSASYRMWYRIRYRIRCFYSFHQGPIQGDPKFHIALDFRFTFTHSCQCFYNNAIQQLNLTIPPRPPSPHPHPGHSPGPALPMHFLRLVGPQNRAACWKLWRSCAAAAAAAWRGGDRHGCTVLQPVMLCAASTGDALLGGSCCCKVVKHAVAVMVASGDGHGVVAVRLHCWSLKFAHVDDVLEYWCSNEDMIFQLSWVQETMSCLSSNW